MKISLPKFLKRKSKIDKYAREALEIRAKRIRDIEKEKADLEEAIRRSDDESNKEMEERLKASEKVLKRFRA